jgi:hypothetical protein
MLSAPIDSLLSLIPRILVFITKWLVILLANILESVMAPKAGGLFFEINRFTSPAGLVYWV